MASTIVDFDQADETREFPHGRWDIVHIGDTVVGRGTMEPGWHWAEHVKPLVGTDSCQQRHVGYLVSGRLRVVMEDGTEMVCEPGQVYLIEPGHDAWSVGEEPVVGLEFSEQSAATYAQKS
jgi:ethanolamine utilization protein EutQ (cupin superfamily)